MGKGKPLIAVINSNEDIIEAIQLMLTDEGYPSASGHVTSFKRRRDNFLNFLKENDPKVILFDIAPPYDKNWNFFQIIKNIKEVEGIPFIVTTTNLSLLKKLAGDVDAHEIVGKPFDMNELIQKIKQAADTISK